MLKRKVFFIRKHEKIYWQTKNERMAEKIKVCNFDKKKKRRKTKKNYRKLLPEQLQVLFDRMEELFAIFERKKQKKLKMTMQEWETENVFQMISRLQIDFNFNNKILLLILKLQYNNNHNINIIKIG